MFIIFFLRIFWLNKIELEKAFFLILKKNPKNKRKKQFGKKLKLE